MNRQGPRVFVVSVPAWWLVWLTRPDQWMGRSRPAPGRRAGVSGGTPRDGVAVYGRQLARSSAILVAAPGSRWWTVRPGFVLWASSAFSTTCTIRPRHRSRQPRWVCGCWQWTVPMGRHISGGSKQGGEEATGLGPLSRRNKLERGPGALPPVGLEDTWFSAFSKAGSSGVEFSQ